MNARPRTVVILQARMGSHRLPGKVLMEIGGKPVLLHCLDRALRIDGTDAVCLATSDQPADDPVADAASQRPEVTVFRGPEDDVLERYRGAAAAIGAAIVMRLTCDCPLVDPEVCGDLLRLRAKTDAVYASNVAVREWPHGLDCEAFLRTALDDAAASATDAYDREHVTPWIRRQAGARTVHLPGPGGAAARQRWTLDYPEDLTFLHALWDALPGNKEMPGWRTIMRTIERHPEIAKLNAARAVHA